MVRVFFRAVCIPSELWPEDVVFDRLVAVVGIGEKNPHFSLEMSDCMDVAC